MRELKGYRRRILGEERMTGSKMGTNEEGIDEAEMKVWWR